MAEIFGAVAAGLSVGSGLIKCGCAIQKAIKKIRNSRKDVEQLAKETIIFGSLYKRFLRACDDDRDAYTTDIIAVTQLISWARKTQSSLEMLLTRIDALQPYSKSSSSLETRLIAHVVWLSCSSTVKALRSSLSVARESMNGFTYLMWLQKLKEDAKIMKEALHDPPQRRELESRFGTTLEAKLRETELELAEAQVVHDENVKTLKDAQDKVTVFQKKIKTASDVPAPIELIEFTRTLNVYAKEVLPSKQPNYRATSSASVSSSSRHRPVSQHHLHTTSRHHLAPENDGSGRTAKSTKNISPTSSTISSTSRKPPATASSSSSEVSVASKKVSDQRPVHRAVHVPDARFTVGVARSELRAREYMNDPDGDILSPPKLRGHDTKGPVHRNTQIGRHIITLRSTDFILNKNVLPINDYQIANAFYHAVVEHEDRLDELDRILSIRLNMSPGSKWLGIPDWEITSRQITCLGGGLKKWGL